MFQAGQTQRIEDQIKQALSAAQQEDELRLGVNVMTKAAAQTLGGREKIAKRLIANVFTLPFSCLPGRRVLSLGCFKQEDKVAA